MKKRNPLFFLPYIVVITMLVFLMTMGGGNNTKNYTYNEFKKSAEKLTFGDVSIGIRDVIIDVNGEYITKKKGEEVKTKFKVTLPKTDKNIAWLEDVVSEKENKVEVFKPSEENLFLNIVLNFLPIVAMLGLGFLLFSKMGNGGQNKAFEFSKSRAKIEGDIKVRFNDVAGCDEEKEEVKEIIDYLKSPTKFSDMGARIPKGMLMVGPPGTGKTLLAKAVAGEANVPFFSISGSDFVEMFVGTGASRVRDMFKKAKQAAPCIVFIDEIDAVGRQRGAGMGGGNDEREQTLNQLLVEMDGMAENTGIVIIAATNRPDVLDPALLRSGRFDRQITVSLPDKKGRTEILEVHARNKKMAADVSLENLAKRTPSFSGADLENVLNEAAILAVREERKEITMDDLDEAIDRVIMGPAKKSKKYDEEDKKLVAYHEAGHAVIGIKLDDADNVQKVTIIPRGDAGGYNLMTPETEKYFHRKREYMAQITGLLGGRVSEEIVFGEISAGAVNDIEKITKIAKAMVRVFGMSSLGPIQYADPQGNVFLGRDYGSNNDYSAGVAAEIDKEVRIIVDECYEHCKKILTENRELLDLLAKTLIEEETLTSEQIHNLVNYGKITSPEDEAKLAQAKIDTAIAEAKKAEEEANKVETEINEVEEIVEEVNEIEKEVSEVEEEPTIKTE